MPSSYSLPELVKKEIGALVKAGYYWSKSDVVKEALATFLYSRRNLRLAATVELYKEGKSRWAKRPRGMLLGTTWGGSVPSHQEN